MKTLPVLALVALVLAGCGSDKKVDQETTQLTPQQRALRATQQPSAQEQLAAAAQTLGTACSGGDPAAVSKAVATMIAALRADPALRPQVVDAANAVQCDPATAAKLDRALANG